MKGAAALRRAAARGAAADDESPRIEVVRRFLVVPSGGRNDRKQPEPSRSAPLRHRPIELYPRCLSGGHGRISVC